MSMIIIEKYVDGLCVEEYRLPAGPLRFLARLLPGRARRDLLRRGLDLDALLAPDAIPSPAQWLDVAEKQIAKRIRLSRRD